jgi:GT2 family glycosyltransferase
MKTASVVAVIATYHRPRELERLLDSLATLPRHLTEAIVVDNGAATKTRVQTQHGRVAVLRIAPGKNLGCGGGLRLAEQIAVTEFPDATHFWILDDDTVVQAETLDVLLAAMEKEHAEAAHPLVVAGDGLIGWFPGLLDPTKFRVIRVRQTPADFIAQCGGDPIPFSWSQGIALLITRGILERIGFHRDDYWVRGEDLEFTLRITARARGIYVPQARVTHLPPQTEGGDDGRPGEYAKHRAMLQNLAYTSFRLRHGWRLLRTLPGNWLRFFRIWGWSRATVRDCLRTILRGGFNGQPAGASSNAAE